MKWRLFRSLLNGQYDYDAERVYLWHIERRRASGFYDAEKPWGTFLVSVQCLLDSMRAFGFDPLSPIPVDPNGELLGGAHRTACALALGLEEVWVEKREKHVWAPPWGLGWFVDQGMDFADLARTKQDFKALMEMRQ